MNQIIAPVCNTQIQEEINRLGNKSRILSRRAYHVYEAKASKIPNILIEIGRLREMTFREVGEGTGLICDNDEYDQHYRQIFLWDEAKQKIIGAYRLGMGQELFRNSDISNFYLSSLFHFDKDIYPLLQQSIELGRSFIIKEFQKGYLPLFLLWKGILKVITKNPNYKYLIGPVSISNYYSSISKELIVHFIQKNFYDAELAKHIEPKSPFAFQSNKSKRVDLLSQVKGNDLKDLENFLQSLEHTKIQIPVLLKRYAMVNAKFVGFNVDANFSNVLDCLIVLKLENVCKNQISILNDK